MASPVLLYPDLDKHKCNNSIVSDVYVYATRHARLFRQDNLFEHTTDVFWSNAFHDLKNDHRVMATVTKGARPSRPSHDLSRIRGLDDTKWNIIGSRWSHVLNDRLSIHQIVESLRLSHDFADDQRLFDFISSLMLDIHSHLSLASWMTARSLMSN
jgi:hypothetical protein